LVGRFHRSKYALALAVAAPSFGACNKDPRVTTRSVTLHAACTSPVATLEPSDIALYDGLGDFEPAAGPVGGHPAGDVGDVLSEVPAATRALFVQATAGDHPFWGLGTIAGPGGVDVLMMPALASCALQAPAGDPAVARDGAVMGVAGDGAVLVVGGGTSKPSTWIVHLDTGLVADAVPDLGTPRLRASVTAFGAGALVAGGVNPSSPASPLALAEVYDSALGGFDQQNPIRLSEARADHGAVVLADGETLLVGGTSDGSTVLASMEIVDPVTRTVRAENVPNLAVGRRNPTVLRLASGEILVAGGLDGAGNAVPTLEWFSPDVSAASKRATDLVAGSARAYTALAAGGALAVIAPPAGAPSDFQNTWVIDADGVLEAAPPLAGALTRPVLFGAAGGAPVLWTGDRWLRWQPWAVSFGALGELDPTPAQISDVVVSPDPGLAAWLDSAAWTFAGLRFDSRSEFSDLPGPLLLTDASELAPDRLASPGEDAFDANAAALTLDVGASAFVTDRTYADVRVDVDVAHRTHVVLRDATGAELEVGGAACPDGAPDAAATLEVVRKGVTVSWSLSGAAAATSGVCPTTLAPGARVAVGLRGAATGGEPPSTARNLRVVRLTDP
jgi:hypothetical protein